MAMVRQNWWNKRYDSYYIGLKQEIKDKIRQAYRDLDLHSGGCTRDHYELLLEYVGDYDIKGESLTEKNNRIKKNYDTNSRPIRESYYA
jgi:methionine synthase II (cobalamin-independent)